MKLFATLLTTLALGFVVPALAAPADSDIRDGDRFEDVCNMTDRNILFGYDSAELSEQQEADVAEAAWCLTAGALEGEDIILMGHTGPSGDREDNYELALERAKAVKSSLVKMGVAPWNIRVVSVGEDHENLYEQDRKDRRVSIIRNFSTKYDKQ